MKKLHFGSKNLNAAFNMVRVSFKDLTELRGTEQYRIRIISVSHL